MQFRLKSTTIFGRSSRGTKNAVIRNILKISKILKVFERIFVRKYSREFFCIRNIIVKIPL